MLTTYKSNVRINKSFEINSKADIFDLCHTKHPAMAFAHIAQNLCPQFMAKVMNFKGKKMRFINLSRDKMASYTIKLSGYFKYGFIKYGWRAA